MPTSWTPIMAWLNTPSKNNAPTPAQVLAGMQEFIQAAYVENAQIDQTMLSALLPGH